MPTIVYGVQAVSTGAGVSPDFDFQRVIISNITNVSGESVQFSTNAGGTWTTISAGASASPGVVQASSFRLRRGVPGAYPAPVSITFDEQFTLTTESGAVVALSEVVTEVLANPSATTTVLSGAGLYSHYRCTATGGNITVYDSLTATGKVLVPTTSLAVGVFPIFGAGNPNRLAVANGVTVVLSGAGVVYVGAGVE